MELDEPMNRFCLASREIFNHYFRVPDPYDNDGWVLEERFSEIEALLFEKLVIEPAGLPQVRYGVLQPGIRVELLHGESVPVMLNRDKDSGYWDHPIRKMTRGARLAFITFFDWDQLAYRDNRYVRVQVEEWKSHSEAVGKHALIESQYVRFVGA